MWVQCLQATPPPPRPVDQEFPDISNVEVQQDAEEAGQEEPEQPPPAEPLEADDSEATSSD